MIAQSERLISKLVAISESREIDKMESRGGGKLMGLIGDEVGFNRLLDCRARARIIPYFIGYLGYLYGIPPWRYRRDERQAESQFPSRGQGNAGWGHRGDVQFVSEKK